MHSPHPLLVTADRATDSLTMAVCGERSKICTVIHVCCFQDENLKGWLGPECTNRSLWPSPASHKASAHIQTRCFSSALDRQSLPELHCRMLVLSSVIDMLIPGHGSHWCVPQQPVDSLPSLTSTLSHHCGPPRGLPLYVWITRADPAIGLWIDFPA